MNRSLLNLVMAVSLFICGCTAPAGRSAARGSGDLVSPADAPSTAPVGPVATGSDVGPDAPAAVAARSEWVYWGVDESEAETVLVATLQSQNGGDRFEMPLKRFPPGKRPAEHLVEQAGYLHARSASGDAFCVRSSFAVVDKPSPGVTLRVWESPNTNTLGAFLFGIGSVSAVVTVPADRPSEHVVAEGATLHVSFREPVKSTAPIDHGPREWEQHIERERDDSADVPLPPAWGRN